MCIKMNTTHTQHRLSSTGSERIPMPNTVLWKIPISCQHHQQQQQQQQQEQLQ